MERFGEQAHEESPKNVYEADREEKVSLTSEELKDIIGAQLNGKAKINSLELTGEDGKIKLSAELDAGMLGGKISLEGFITNAGDGISVENPAVEARGYVKSAIEKNLFKLTPTLREYFERKYGRPITQIKIDGSNLDLTLGDKRTNDTAAPELENQTMAERAIRWIQSRGNRASQSEALGSYLLGFVEKKQFDDAEKIAGLIRDEAQRNSVMESIASVRDDHRLIPTFYKTYRYSRFEV